MRRRDFLFYATAFTAAAGLRRGQAQSSPEAPSALRTLFDAFVDEDLRRAPETATQLGLDRGARSALSSQLADAGQGGLAAERRATEDKLRRLAAIDRTRLSASERVFYDTAVHVEEAKRRIQSFDYVAFDTFGASPYAISPQTGVYGHIPVFLDTKHRIETSADADAYLARLTAFATALDANTDRFRSAAGQGVSEPDFLLDTTLRQLATLQVSPEASGLVTSLDRRAQAKGLGSGPGRAAARIYRDLLAPALERQVNALKTARVVAQHEPGVWRFKDGEAFYRANLQFTTTTSLTPDEIHQIGLDQVRLISDRMDGLLKAHGLTRGTVGERMNALYDDPAQFYPDTPAGREKLIADLQIRVDRMRVRLPKMFDVIPKDAIEVRAVPREIDAGAPLAYHDRAPLDRSRPAYIYFNLHDIREWPRFNLPTCVYHESLPGHALQGETAGENVSIPVYVKRLYLPGYGEGWATYGEQLADELGAYDDDPLGRLGFLKFQIFRAGRLVIDTGMNHLRWSREQAVAYITGIDGDAVSSTTREVDKHIAVPAQACSNMIGFLEWNRLRDRSRTELGAKFDLRSFHHAGLSQGAMPLAVLDRVVADWTRSTKG